jgi:hypothetical protein
MTRSAVGIITRPSDPSRYANDTQQNTSTTMAIDPTPGQRYVTRKVGRLKAKQKIDTNPNLSFMYGCLETINRKNTLTSKHNAVPNTSEGVLIGVKRVRLKVMVMMDYNGRDS